MKWTKKKILESLSHVEDDDAEISIIIVTKSEDGEDEGFIVPIAEFGMDNSKKQAHFVGYNEER